MRELGGEIRSIPQDSIKAGHQGGGVDHNVSSGREIRIGAIVTHHPNFRTRGLGEGGQEQHISHLFGPGTPVLVPGFQWGGWQKSVIDGKSQIMVPKIRALHGLSTDVLYSWWMSPPPPTSAVVGN